MSFELMDNGHKSKKEGGRYKERQSRKGNSFKIKVDLEFSKKGSKLFVVEYS